MTTRDIWRWALLLPVSWWSMMAIHELGHVAGCLVSHARIDAVVLWPWTISETIRSDSQAPLVDTWAGPLLGMPLPVLVWLGLRRCRLGPWIGGWAGFCLIANGLYLGLGWTETAGDSADLLHLGVPAWVLITVGGCGIGGGLWLWHRLLDGHRRQAGR